MKAENYLYEIEPQGRSKSKLSGRGPGASMTRGGCRMEEGKMGMRTGKQGRIQWGPNRE